MAVTEARQPGSVRFAFRSIATVQSAWSFRLLEVWSFASSKGDLLKAFTVVQTSESTQLTLSDVPSPKPASGEVVVQIKAAGVIPTELLWYPTTHTKDGKERLQTVPGHEFSGVIKELGEGVTEFALGDAIFGMNDWFESGATAELCVAPVTSLSRKPPQMDHVVAATVPISALTAWQALVTRAKAQAGERLLIVGAGGAVGLMAVQVAKILGCHVIASASQTDFALLKRLGVDEVIDYQTSRFEKQTNDLDIVFDTVGSDTLHRAAPLLSARGRLFTIAADAEGKEDAIIAKAFFIVEPAGEDLERISQLISNGAIETFVKAVVPFQSAPQAYLDKGLGVGQAGKIVIQVDPAT